MPSLSRFLAVLALLAALGYGVLYGLATFVHPAPRTMVAPVTVPD